MWYYVSGFLTALSIIFLYLRISIQRDNKSIKNCNVINGVVYPSPNDPRWVICNNGWKEKSESGYTLGNITCWYNCIEIIDDNRVSKYISTKKAKTYYYQIEKTVSTRIADKSVNDTKLLKDAN